MKAKRLPYKTKKIRNLERRQAIKFEEAFMKEQGELGMSGFRLAMAAVNQGIPLPELPELPSGQADYSKLLGRGILDPGPEFPDHGELEFGDDGGYWGDSEIDSDSGGRDEMVQSDLLTRGVRKSGHEARVFTRWQNWLETKHLLEKGVLDWTKRAPAHEPGEYSDLILVDVRGWSYADQSFSRDAESLLNLGYFPGSPKRVDIAYGMELMRLGSSMWFENNSMEQIYKILLRFWGADPPKDLYKGFSDALFMFIRVKTLLDMNERKETTGSFVVECPACSPDIDYTGPIIKMMDGNFSQKRYINAGSKIHAPFFEDAYLTNINEDTDGNAPEEGCSNTRSGDDRKKADPRCDITGIFGSVCPHGVPFKFFDIKNGEKLVYGEQIVKCLKERFPEAELKVGYDIWCKLNARVINSLENVSGFIPSMHSYNHVERCQVQFAPRMIMGLGNEYGEQTEQLWWKIDSFAIKTRWMRPENRHDALTCKYHDIACEAASNVDASILRIFNRTMVKLKNVKEEMDEQSVEPKKYCEVLQYVENSRNERLAEINGKAILPNDAILARAMRSLRDVELMNAAKRTHIGTKKTECLNKRISNKLKNVNDCIEDLNARGVKASISSLKSSLLLVPSENLFWDLQMRFWKCIEDIELRRLEVANAIAYCQQLEGLLGRLETVRGKIETNIVDLKAFLDQIRFMKTCDVEINGVASAVAHIKIDDDNIASTDILVSVSEAVPANALVADDATSFDIVMANSDCAHAEDVTNANEMISLKKIDDELERTLNNPDEKIICSRFNIPYSVMNLKSLNPECLLDDNTINMYFELIRARSENIGLWDTHFYPQYLRGYECFKKYTKRADYLDYEKLLIPLHLGNSHWACLVIDFQAKTLFYYDSLHWDGSRHLERVYKWLNLESIDKKQVAFDYTGWEMCAPKVPRQYNNCDCGVFTCLFAEHASRSAQFDFSASDIPYYRKRISYEILMGELL